MTKAEFISKHGEDTFQQIVNFGSIFKPYIYDRPEYGMNHQDSVITCHLIYYYTKKNAVLLEWKFPYHEYKEHNSNNYPYHEEKFLQIYYY